MKTKGLLMMSFLAVLTFFSFSTPLVEAQSQVYFQPVELYRFRVSNTNLGYFLTPYYSEGINKGFTYDAVAGFIYIPAFGFTPTNPGLRAVHQWRVIQNGREYYYYSPNFRTLGSDYTYQGIRGYMYDPSLNEVMVPTIGGGSMSFPLYKVQGCYSQTYGYWQRRLTPIGSNPPVYNGESPPAPTYNCGAEHEIFGGGVLTIRGTSPNSSPQISDQQVSEGEAGNGAKGGSDSPIELFSSPY